MLLLTLESWAAVSPLVPRKTMAKAEEMLKGEKKMFSVELFSVRVLNSSKAKRVLAVLMVKAATRNQDQHSPLLHQQDHLP